MKPNLCKGVVAGVVGGLVASYVMNRFQRLWTRLAYGEEKARRRPGQGGQVKKSESQRRPRREGESATETAAARISKKLFGRRLGRDAKKRYGRLLHYAFGAASGAAYGAAVELAPTAAAGAGLPFGTAVWIAADEVAVPAAGLSRSPSEYPFPVHAQSFFSHLLYGATTDAVRRILRNSMG